MPTTPITDWTGTPRNHSSAKPTDYRTVKNSRVVTLSKAFIRGSEVSGTFLLADNAVLKTYAGRERIEVQCLWFGRKPHTTWMNITLLCVPKFDSNYSGKVVSDLRK